MEKNFLGATLREISDMFDNMREEKKSSKDKPVTEPVRMFNKVDVDRESVQAVNSNYKLSGDFNNIFSSGFCGKIFGNI